MKIELNQITVREIVEGYIDNDEEGVVGYGGKLNIRPKYQREFVYDEKERNAVINTIFHDFPLNIMYWAKNDDETYEVLDGQQRTISFCQYVKGAFSINERGFNNLTETEKKQILDYKLNIYVCEGNDKEKLEWFRIVNIAGKKLTNQELRNITYTGTWLSDAKLKFSKSNCAAYLLSKRYVKGNPIQQQILETALDWINNGNIEGYMSIHQHDPNANELWTYFKNVIDWVELTFTTYRREMKGINWGKLYNQFKGQIFDTQKIEQEIQKLMIDDDVQNKKGIYSYILTHNERHLNIRSFTESQKRIVYEKQNGICTKCGKYFEINETHADHITPWSKGGKTILENCQILCADCNRHKSDI